MKNILLKFYSFCFLLVIVSFFSACSDDKITMYGAYNEAVFSMVGENGRKALRTKGFKYDRENGLNISKRFSFT